MNSKVIGHIDLTDGYGSDIAQSVQNQGYLYKIVILSIPYNKRGAYYSFENTYICPGDTLYDALTMTGTLKNLYVSFYNDKKEECEKHDKPDSITEDMIKSINVYILPSDYVPYYCR